jgi:tRNA (guanine-N7-)-methyltransferase
LTDNNDRPVSSPDTHAHIRSFVRRAGRLTPGQRRAIETHWTKFGVEPGTAVDLPALFGRPAPVTLEIGFGAGENLLNAARQAPECNFLGIEVHAPGVGQVLAGAAREGLTNIRLFREDAIQVLTESIHNAALAEAWIFFPDPWPKKRHHKRRLINAPFVQLIANKLTPGGCLRLATDWEEYAHHMVDMLEQSPQLRNEIGARMFSDRFAGRVETRFATRGARLGHGVWDMAYRKSKPE